MDELTAARVRLLSLEASLAKAKKPRTGKRRIPGDGDGDGLVGEGKKKGSGLGSIALKHLGIPTLKAQNSDSKDFHDVSVWGVKAALDAAFQAGGGKGAFPSAGKVANQFLDIPTLQRQNSDRADFHNVAVWNVKSALDAAYEAGKGTASTAKTPDQLKVGETMKGSDGRTYTGWYKG